MKELQNQNIEKEITDIEEIKEMIRHLHQDVENVKRELFVDEYRLIGITYMLEDLSKNLEFDGNTIDEKTIDEIVNVPPNVYDEAERCYTPIDEKDRLEWEEHQKSEIIEKEKFEEM